MKEKKQGIVIGKGEFDRFDAGFYIPDFILKENLNGAVTEKNIKKSRFDKRIKSALLSALRHEREIK